MHELDVWPRHELVSPVAEDPFERRIEGFEITIHAGGGRRLRVRQANNAPIPRKRRCPDRAIRVPLTAMLGTRTAAIPIGDGCDLRSFLGRRSAAGRQLVIRRSPTLWRGLHLSARATCRRRHPGRVGSTPECTPGGTVHGFTPAGALQLPALRVPPVDLRRAGGRLAPSEQSRRDGTAGGRR